MRKRQHIFLPVLLLVAGVMAIVGSLLMQEWQIQQDAQEYEQLVLEVRATVQASAAHEVPEALVETSISPEETLPEPLSTTSITPVPSALPMTTEPTVMPVVTFILNRQPHRPHLPAHQPAVSTLPPSKQPITISLHGCTSPAQRSTTPLC